MPNSGVTWREIMQLYRAAQRRLALKDLVERETHKLLYSEPLKKCECVRPKAVERDVLRLAAKCECGDWILDSHG